MIPWLDFAAVKIYRPPVDPARSTGLEPPAFKSQLSEVVAQGGGRVGHSPPGLTSLADVKQTTQKRAGCDDYAVTMDC